MKKQPRGIQPPMVGSSSLLMAFAVLCLTVFALLSLSTVQADKRLSLASAQSVQDYYRADSRAEELFARLRGGEMPADVEFSQGIYRFSCPVGENQTLAVELERTEDGWRVLRWQTLAPEYLISEDLPVWDGE